jgi:hypothetical protein
MSDSIRQLLWRCISNCLQQICSFSCNQSVCSCKYRIGKQLDLGCRASNSQRTRDSEGAVFTPWSSATCMRRSSDARLRAETNWALLDDPTHTSLITGTGYASPMSTHLAVQNQSLHIKAICRKQWTVERLSKFGTIPRSGTQLYFFTPRPSFRPADGTDCRRTTQ